MSARFRNRAPRALAAAVVAACSICACGGGAGGTGGGGAGLPPVADAGPDQVGLVGTVVTLDGRGSTGPAGTTLRYQWTQTGGPATVFMSAPQSSLPNFIPAAVGAYEFEVQVVAGGGGPSDADRAVVVVVDDLSPAAQRAPAAELRAAYLLHAVFLGVEPALRAGSPVQLVRAGGSEALAAFVDLVADAADDPPPGSVASLLPVDVVVRGVPFARLYFPWSPDDPDATEIVFDDGSRAPVRAFGVVGAAYVLDGSRSHDDGAIKNYHWRHVSGLLTLDTADAALAVVPLIADRYEWELIVTDDVGLTSFPWRVTVPVVPAGPLVSGPPLAMVTVLSGAEGRLVGQTTVFASEVGRTVTLDGRASLSFADGEPASGSPALQFSWQQLSGPTAPAAGSTSSVASFQPGAPGGYEFELKVTDAHGVSDTADLWVSVATSGGVAPVAALKPVPDQVLPLPGQPPRTVALDGTSSQGTAPLTFHWTQVKGTPVFVEQASVGRGRVAIDQPGLYEFQLRVFDGHVYSPPAIVSFQVR